MAPNRSTIQTPILISTHLYNGGISPGQKWWWIVLEHRNFMQPMGRFSLHYMLYIKLQKLLFKTEMQKKCYSEFVTTTTPSCLSSRVNFPTIELQLGRTYVKTTPLWQKWPRVLFPLPHNLQTMKKKAHKNVFFLFYLLLRMWMLLTNPSPMSATSLTKLSKSIIACPFSTRFRFALLAC